jgi:hypothetical protein
MTILDEVVVVWYPFWLTKGCNMKVVGIGTQLKLGTVLRILKDSVVVSRQGKNVNVTFSQVEHEVFGG